MTVLPTSTIHRTWFHPLLLLVWTLLGAALRFTNLTAKPLWTDEFATIVFSLGHSFLTVPLDQPISAETLLEPLRYTPSTGVSDVVRHLLTESNHPPLYFVLTHLWLGLFQPAGEYVSVWGVRSLSVLFGVAAIPAVYGLSRLAFRSRLVGHIAAVLMTLSPFGIYLAQEARHYTLPMLWILASLSCLIVAVRALCDRTPLPFWIVLVWTVVNGLGLATHYFFALVLVAEAIVFAGLGSVQLERWVSWFKPISRFKPVALSQLPVRGIWLRIGLVAVGTLASGLVWLPFLQRTQDSELTRWIYRDDRIGLALLEPLAQLLGGWMTMLYLLPIQADNRAIARISIVLILLAAAWTAMQLYQGIRVAYGESQRQLPIVVLGGFVGAAIALFLGITYVFGMDVTSAFRYNFVYFPAVMVLVGVGLAVRWQSGRRSVVMAIALFSLLGSLTVITNLGYQKTHRPDLVTAAIQKHSHHPVLVAIAHHTHGQTGRLMGIAWEWQNMHHAEVADPLFLLAHQDQDERSPIRVLRRSLASLPRPLDLWLINMQTVPERPLQAVLKQQNCAASDEHDSVDGYRYELYRCG